MHVMAHMTLGTRTSFGWWLTLAMMVALPREEDFKLHVKPALKNGLTLEELRALLLHASIYAGVPASNAAFRWMRDVLGDELDKVKPA